MINKINEPIYNYIFSVNEGIKNDLIEENIEIYKKLDNIISKNFDVIADFWDENKDEFNNGCVIRTESIDQDYPEYIYNNFPRMTQKTKISYLDYKKEQIRKSIEDNGDFLEKEIEKIMVNIDNIGKKTIFDYCKEEGILNYKGKVYFAADDNPAYDIIYDNIKANIKVEKNIDEKEYFLTSYLFKYEIKNKLPDSANASLYVVVGEDGKEYIAKLISKNVDSNKRSRFKNEINFGKKYQNDNVIEIIDNGIKYIEGNPYMFYIMPKYKCDLRQLMKEGIEKSDILLYFNQILEGVKFIHSKNAFHRDLKPENILFDENSNKLIISDMGIAHFCEDDLIDNPKTKLRDKIANFLYAAPEQRERREKVDNRCDIYSLGLILNELYTGQVVAGSNYIKIGDVCNEYSFLDEIVDKMINQNPNKRYSNIETIQYDINTGISIYNEIQNTITIQKLEITDGEDELVSNPVKIIDVELDDAYKLTITFNNNLNKLWIDSLYSVDKRQLRGVEPEKFKILDNKAVIILKEQFVDEVPKIVEYFKEWIESTNRIYPKEAKKKKEEEERKREQVLKAEKEKKDKLDNIRKKIKI